MPPLDGHPQALSSLFLIWSPTHSVPAGPTWPWRETLGHRLHPEIVTNVLCLCFCLSHTCTHMYTCICVYRAGIFTSSWNELWDSEAFPLAEQSSEQAFDSPASGPWFIDPLTLWSLSVGPRTLPLWKPVVQVRSHKTRHLGPG